MEFYEASDFGLRVVTVEYINPENSVQRVRLIPLCHIGEKEYYRKVSEFIDSCDKILFEGIRFKSGKINIKNRQRLASGLNLVVQPRFRKGENKEKFIHADFDEVTGLAEWQKLTRLEKVIHNYVYPIWIYFQDRKLTRQKFVKYFMKSNEDLIKIYGPLFDEKESIKDFIHKSRDTIVFEKIDELLEQMKTKEYSIGILYGAGHMKAISNFLRSKHDFRFQSAEFIEVFKM